MPFCSSIRFLDRSTLPSPSFTRTTKTSISSPGCTTWLGTTVVSLLNSPLGITPSDLKPRLTETSSPTTWITVPFTTSPVCRVTRESSSICSKLTSSTFTFSISLIVTTTSLIIAGGVDAPAVIPILSSFLKVFNTKSQIVSIWTVFSQFFLQISTNFCVLELFLSPMTIILSTFWESSMASFCLFSVAEQMVWEISIFSPFSRKMASISSNLLWRKVVCTTTA